MIIIGEDEEDDSESKVGSIQSKEDLTFNDTNGSRRSVK